MPGPELHTLGNIVVPFADEHKIPIDNCLTPKVWPKLLVGLPALRRAAESGDVKAFKVILKDARTFSCREAMRLKYVRSHSKLGRGLTIRCEDGRLVLVAILDHEEADEELAIKLGRVLDLNGHNPEAREELLGALAAALQTVVAEK